MRDDFNTCNCLLTLGIVLLALLPTTGQAHHSTNGFDSSTQITITGTVARVEWVNPHVYIYIDAESDNGELVRWEIEGQPPAALRRLGWSREMLSAGETIAVTGNPPKNGTDSALLGQLFEKVDGVLFDEAEAMNKLAADANVNQVADSLNGIWTTKLDLSVFPHFFFAAGDEELTDKGVAEREAYDEHTMNPGISCIPLVAPSIMLMPDTKRITINRQNVIIASDYDGIERTIHTNVANHDGASNSLHGHSIGRWEDKSLLIDTTHFTASVIGNGNGLPSGAQKHLTESLSLTANGKGLNYSFELSDPEFIATPITGAVEWAYRPDLEYVTEECNLENAERYLKYF